MERDWQTEYQELQARQEAFLLGQRAALLGVPSGEDGPDCGDCPFIDGAPDASPPPCGVSCPGAAVLMERLLIAEQKAVSLVCVGCNQWLACGGRFRADCEEDEADREFHAEQAARREEALGR